MRHPATPEMKAEATRLRATGLTFNAIGARFGVSGSAIQYWVKDDFAARKREAMKIHKGLQRAEERETKGQGGRPGVNVLCTACGGRHHPDDCEETVRKSCRCGLSLFTDFELATGKCGDCLPARASDFAAQRMVTESPLVAE